MAASLHKSGPAAPGVDEEARGCYRKLRSNLSGLLATFCRRLSKPSVSLRYQLLLRLTLRTHVLRGYASLLLQHAAALQERHSRRTLEGAREALAEVNELLLGITGIPASSPWDTAAQAQAQSADLRAIYHHHHRRQPQAFFGSLQDYHRALNNELNQSNILDAWSLCFLHLYKCEDAARPAAQLLVGFGRNIMILLVSEDAERGCSSLLLSAPRLQYLIGVHMARFLDLLDGGGVCGLPRDAPDAPLFDGEGELVRANRPGAVSASLVLSTVTIWYRILVSAQTAYDNADEGVDPMQLALGQQLPWPMTGSELQHWLLLQLGGRGGGDRGGVPPLRLRATLLVCTRAARVAVDGLRAARAAATAPAAPVRRAARADPPRLSESDSSALFRCCMGAASTCLDFLSAVPRFPGDPLLLRPADSDKVEQLWKLYVAAAEASLGEPQLQPSPPQEQRRRPHGRDGPAAAAAAASDPECDLERVLNEVPRFCGRRGAQGFGSGATAHPSDVRERCVVAAKAAWRAGVVPLAARLIRERGRFHSFGGEVPWIGVLTMEGLAGATALMAAAGEHMRLLVTRDRPALEGAGRLREVTAPLAWVADVLPVRDLRVAADRCAASLGGEAGSGAAVERAGSVEAGGDGYVWFGDDGSGGADGDDDAVDGEEDVFGGLFARCQSCGDTVLLTSVQPPVRKLAALYTAAAADVVGPASRLFQAAAELVCLLRACGPLAADLEEHTIDLAACAPALLEWCQLLLTARVAAVTTAATAAAASCCCSSAAGPPSSPRSSSPSSSSAPPQRWRELLLGEVDLFGLLGACAELLGGPKWAATPPPLQTARDVASALRGPFMSTLGLAHAAFPGELRQALTSPPRRIALLQKQVDAPLGFAALRDLVGHGGPCADTELLGQLAALMRQWSDPQVGEALGDAEPQLSAAAVGVVRRFRAAAALLEPPVRGAAAVMW